MSQVESGTWLIDSISVPAAIVVFSVFEVVSYKKESILNDDL